MSLPILYAGNGRVFDGILISLLSVIKHCDANLDVWVLTMDLRDIDEAYAPITEKQRAFLEDICREKNPESRVHLYDAGQHYRDTLLHAPNQNTQYTPFAFLRLYATHIQDLPDLVLYLDTDTVAMDDISKFFSIPMENHEFAGVRDHYGCHFFGINYINSGVLLLNLKQIRKTRLFENCLELCGRKKIFLPDQTALNRLVKAKKILPRCYNEQKKIRKNTIIRHFSMTIRWIPFRTQNIKPWNIDGIHNILHVTEIDDILESYLSLKNKFLTEKEYKIENELQK